MPTGTSQYDFLAGPAAERGGVTLWVTERLRRAIVTLELKPGEVLDKAALCARLGVSRFPVSEALARLQSEGLVDIAPQRGSAVSLVRIGDVQDYMLIRKALECEVVRAVSGSVTQSLLARLADNLVAQRHAAAADDRETFHNLDLAFHEMLVDGLPYTKLRTGIDAARAYLDRARRLIISPRRLAFSLSEHQAIHDALAKGDGIGAVGAMRAHIDSVMAELFDFARDRQELFADGGAGSANAMRHEFPFG
jgi:GntR family transcriptional regulator, rspAB operon transcriptional repressor